MALLRRFLRHPCHRRFFARAWSSSTSVPKVAIVGSGPAGFYTAQQLLKSHPTVHVDIYEKLPVPFGLVRFGVAPDHPEVKNCINKFTKTAENERCSFLGNVTVGEDITVRQLRNAYSAVVMAYGSDDDKRLGIPGEDLNGVLSARSFVGWYNGLPQERELPVNLDVDTVMVLGQGNVAIDVARILLTPIDVLEKTDITAHSLEVLRQSRVRRVLLVGRRGPLQAAFTTAELREMLRLPGCRPILNRADFEPYLDQVKDLLRARRRLTDLMMDAALKPAQPEDAEQWANSSKEWQLKFLRSPLEILTESGGNIVSGVRLGINRLEGDTGSNQRAVPTGEHEDISCGLVLRSIGYKSVPIDAGVPFDAEKAVIPNLQGRVTDEPGLYCSGWVKRGPVGVIVSTMTDAFETARHIAEDLSNSPPQSPPGQEAVIKDLESAGVKFITFSDWTAINRHEEMKGDDIGKPREKIVVIEEMINIVQGLQKES